MVRKLVWFSPSLNQVGGGERVIMEGLRHYSLLGIESYGVAFEFDKKSLFNNTYNPNLAILNKPKTFFGKIYSLRKWLLKFNPEIIVTQGQWSSGIFLYLATLGTHLHYSLHIFGSIFVFPDDTSKYALVFKKTFSKVRNSMNVYRKIIPTARPAMSIRERLLLEVNALLKYLSVKKSSHIFTLSHQNAWEVNTLYRRRATVLRGAFPNSIFSYNPVNDIKKDFNIGNRKCILTVGRLAANKKIDAALRGFALYVQQNPDTIFIVGGVGSEEKKLKSLVTKLGISDKIIFAGLIPNELLFDYIASADVFVSMDIADYDITPLEALALNTPTIVSEEFETTDELKDINVLYNSSHEPQSIFNALDKILNTTDEKLSPTSLQALKKLTWNNYFDRQLEIMVSNQKQ